MTMIGVIRAIGKHRDSEYFCTAQDNPSFVRGINGLSSVVQT